MINYRIIENKTFFDFIISLKIISSVSASILLNRKTYFKKKQKKAKKRIL